MLQLRSVVDEAERQRRGGREDGVRRDGERQQTMTDDLSTAHPLYGRLAQHHLPTPARNNLRQQEAQLMLTNPRDGFRGRSRSPNMVPFDMLRMVSYQCAVVILSLRQAVFQIFDFKNMS